MEQERDLAVLRANQLEDQMIDLEQHYTTSSQMLARSRENELKKVALRTFSGCI